MDFLHSEINFMPHGHCYFWEPYILWSHAISDSIIALAYFTIPISLVSIVWKRNDFSYIWMIVLFAIFILGCGATHVLDVIDIWIPAYELDGILRIVTAIASIGTAILLIKITPALILYPSAEKWKTMNNELQLLNESLEHKVQERTAALTESAAKFKFLTDHMPQMIWTTNEKGEGKYYNKNWYHYTGLNFEQSIRDSESVIHPEDTEKVNMNWENAFNSGNDFQVELRIKNAADQTYRWHLSRAIPMKDEEGNILEWVGSSTDIHDEKIKSEELERINEDLDNFVYTASHDLRHPITNLEGLHMLVENHLQEKNYQDILPSFHMMQEQVVYLKQIIQDLSDVARIQREEPDDITLQDLEDIFEEFKVSHHKTIENTGAVIQADFAIKNINFSKRHLRSMIYNLLDNALKYRAKNRSPSIVFNTFQEKDFLVIKIQDNGIGIKPAYHDKIFDMFKRYNREQEGTGIGLYIVKRIVEKYKGKIELESEEGYGTIFKIYLKNI